MFTNWKRQEKLTSDQISWKLWLQWKQNWEHFCARNWEAGSTHNETALFASSLPVCINTAPEEEWTLRHTSSSLLLLLLCPYVHQVTNILVKHWYEDFGAIECIQCWCPNLTFIQDVLVFIECLYMFGNSVWIRRIKVRHPQRKSIGGGGCIACEDNLAKDKLPLVGGGVVSAVGGGGRLQKGWWQQLWTQEAVICVFAIGQFEGIYL